MQKSSRACAPYNFLHFSQQYTVHIMDRRGKNRAGFSHVCVCGLQHHYFPPANMCIYIMGSRGANGYGGFAGLWRLELTMDISCLGWMWTRLKSAQTARHGYDAICAHNLFAVYHIDRLPTDSCTSFYDGKMCECAQIFYVKMWGCGWIFIWKMWMMLTLMLIWITICAWK